MFARERLAEKIGLPEARIQVDIVSYSSIFFLNYDVELVLVSSLSCSSVLL